MILKTAMISESALTRKEADKMSFNVEKVKRKDGFRYRILKDTVVNGIRKRTIKSYLKVQRSQLQSISAMKWL